MAARDRFEIGLNCVKCGVEGTAEVSEDDHPWMRSPDFTVDFLPDLFKVKKTAQFREKTEIICVTCGLLVHPKSRAGEASRR